MSRTSCRLALGIALALALRVPAAAQASGTGASAPRVGPAHGALLVVGGGMLGPEILERFIELAGGPDARIVIITTAAGADTAQTARAVQAQLGHSGARNLAVLNTPDPKVADREAFARQLRSARGVWFAGGRQWRLAGAYLGTRTQRELFALLDRGGVIGGTSAGASIQASYMVRGAVEGNTVMMAPGHERGLGFLEGVAVDQHIIARHREGDLAAVIKVHPELLGIGIDEGTAIEV
ncbi:MAG TPA: cyanophycinase, partial [Longimicrobiales bacterium]